MALKFKVDHMTWPCPFRGQFVVRSWDLRWSIGIPNLKFLRLPARKIWKATQKYVKKNSRFGHSLGDIGRMDKAQGSSMASCKMHCQLPISDNW